MLNKKLLPAAVTAALLAGTSLAQAQDEPAIVTGDEFVEGFQISGNVALTSDYRFRGISQSDEDFAVQGGFDAEFGPGFYVGIWGSSVDFDTLGLAATISGFLVFSARGALAPPGLGTRALA